MYKIKDGDWVEYTFGLIGRKAYGFVEYDDNDYYWLKSPDTIINNFKGLRVCF